MDDAYKERQKELIRNFDRKCKKLFSHVDVLSWILKDGITDLNHVAIAEIRKSLLESNNESREAGYVLGLNPEDIDLNNGDVIFDFIVTVDVKEKMYIELEGQKDGKHLGYPISKRAIYYLSRMISRQKGIEFENSDYQKIKKAYSIFIILNGEYKNEIHRQSMYWNNHNGEFIEESDPGMIELIKIYMGRGNEETGCLRLFEIFFFDTRKWEEKKRILREEFDIEMDERMEKEAKEVFEFGEGLAEMYYDKGLLFGEEKNMIECIQNVMKEFGVDINRAMDALKVPADQRESYQKKILSN